MARKKFSYKSLLTVFILLLLSVTYLTYFTSDSSTNKWREVFNYFELSDVNINKNDYKLRVHFLNVGKADCIYISFGENNILIDAADKEENDNVVEYLKRQNVDKLNLVINSHAHRDHIGQMESVVNNFKVDEFIMPDIPEEIIPTYATYVSLLKALERNNVNVELAQVGRKINIDDMELEILAPCNDYDSINNTSVVVKLTYGTDSFLFTGDAEKESENDMIDREMNLKSEVLKVGHHGSNTSTTQKFLNKVKPRYAVISVGPDRNKLPKDKVIKRLQSNGIKIYRTDENGTIVFLSNGNGLEIITERRK